MNKKISGINLCSGGNISILSLISVIVFAFLFLLLIDCCRIFIARSVSKKSADAAVLAAAQDLLFMEKDISLNTANEIVYRNGCKLKEFTITYDKVVVSVEKHLDFVFLKLIGQDKCIITSVSESEIIYPWDDAFGLCRSYRFDYGQ